jgi:hypothetical protein
MNTTNGRPPDPNDRDKKHAPEPERDQRHKDSDVLNKPRCYGQKDVQNRPPPDPDPDDPASP